MGWPKHQGTYHTFRDHIRRVGAVLSLKFFAVGIRRATYQLRIDLTSSKANCAFESLHRALCQVPSSAGHWCWFSGEALSPGGNNCHCQVVCWRDDTTKYSVGRKAFAGIGPGDRHLFELLRRVR